MGGEFVVEDGRTLPESVETAPEPAVAANEAGERLGFIGVYNHSIDGKGRVIVPHPFRALLGKRVVVGVNMAQDSVAVYPYSVWKAKVDMLTDLAREDVAAEFFLSRFAMYSFDGLGFDGQGRVLLPQALRDLYLKDATDVQVSGTTEYVRIISEQQAQQEREQFLTRFPDPLRAISDIQARARDKHGR